MPRVALLECGSNSLKVHFRSGANNEFHAFKIGWQLGRDVFETGSLADETVMQAVHTIEDLLAMGFDRKSLVAIATEGLRDARNRADLLAQLEERLQLKVRVISGREEASLLAEGYLKARGTIPAFLADIGGGSLQLVNISSEKTVLRDSLPLGAIRMHVLGEEEGKPWNRSLVEEFVESQFETACVMKAQQIHATGGTVKSVAKVLEKRVFTAQDLDGLLQRVEKDGAPDVLKPARRAVFLPGLIVLSRLARHTGASGLRYFSVSVGRIFLERLLERLGPALEGDRKGYVADQMRLTNIRPRL